MVNKKVISTIDNPQTATYTITAAEMDVIYKMLGRCGYSLSEHLDNGTVQAIDAPWTEGETDMASKYRETYTYRDEQGRKQTIRFNGKDKRDTDEQFQRFLCSRYETVTSPTVREFVEKVYRPDFVSTLSPTTRDNYNNMLNLNILPFMGDMRMDDVSVAVIQRFMTWMATAGEQGRKKNLTEDTIKRVCGLVSRIFTIAVDMRQTRDNPVKCSLLRNQGEKSEHHKAATDDDTVRVKRSIPTLENEQQRLFVALLVYTGMRREEVCGLRWEHLNIENGYGEVKQAVVYVGSSRRAYIKQPKSKTSIRTFIIPQALAAILEPCRQERGYIIHGEDTEKPACYSRVQRTSRKAFEALGIKGKYCNHDWRATYGTQLSEKGATSKNVADLMGHADSRMVETVYAKTRHESVMKQRETVEKLNENYA